MTNPQQTFSDEKYGFGREERRTSKDFTLARVPHAPKLRILDIGCGTGVNAKAIAEHGHDVFGVDVSPVAIERFRELGFDGEVCDLEKGLPLADRAFDLVFASEVVEHVADTGQFLREAHRVLRPGGRLVLSTPNSAFWPYRLLGLFGFTVSDLQHPGHVRFFTRASLARELKAAGFTDGGIAARHIYLIVGGAIGRVSGPVLEALGFQREMRVRTGNPFWHLSRFAERANGFWADTLIVTASKAD